MKNIIRHMKPGKAYRFQFPEYPFHGIYSRYEDRHVQVLKIRDLKKEPIEHDHIEIQPLLIRGRFCVIGYDIERKELQVFYGRSIRNIRLGEIAEVPKEINDEFNDWQADELFACGRF